MCLICLFHCSCIFFSVFLCYFVHNSSQNLNAISHLYYFDLLPTWSTLFWPSSNLLTNLIEIMMVQSTPIRKCCGLWVLPITALPFYCSHPKAQFRMPSHFEQNEALMMAFRILYMGSSNKFCLLCLSNPSVHLGNLYRLLTCWKILLVFVTLNEIISESHAC